MTTDWTKPVEFADGTHVRVERMVEDGKAIISWKTPSGTMATVVKPGEYNIRNVPPKPRERWIYKPTFQTAYDAPPVDSHNYTRVREVLDDGGEPT